MRSVFLSLVFCLPILAGAPSITSTSAGTISLTGASISWVTNQPFYSPYSCSAAYGTTTSYGSTTGTTTGGIVGITGLTSGTTYHYQVTCNNGYAQAVSSDATFATLSSIPTAPARTMIDNEGGVVLLTPTPGYSSLGAGTYIGYPVTAFSGMTAVGAAKLNHTVWYAGGAPDDMLSGAYYPASELQSYNQNEIAAGNNGLLVTATNNGIHYPLISTISGNGCYQAKQWANVIDPRYVRFFVNEIGRKIMLSEVLPQVTYSPTSLSSSLTDNPYYTNSWISTDEAGWQYSASAIYPNGCSGSAVSSPTWDTPFPQTDGAMVASLQGFAYQTHQFAPDVKLAANEGTITTEALDNWYDLFGQLDGLDREGGYANGGASPQQVEFGAQHHIMMLNGPGNKMLLERQATDNSSQQNGNGVAWYLIWRGGNSFFSLANGTTQVAQSTYQATFDMLGAPTANYVETQTGANSYNSYYSRTYQGGIVYFNGDSSSNTVTLPSTLNGSSVTNWYLNGTGTAITPGTNETLAANTNADTVAGEFFTTANTTFVQEPVYSPPTLGTTITGPVTVTLTDATSSSAIHYTTDGTTPTCSSTTYSGTFNLSTTTTVKAVGCATGDTTSWVKTAAYTITATNPTVQISQPTDSANAFFPETYANVVLSHPSASSITVNYTVSGTAGVTFSPSSGSMVIPAFETSRSAMIQAVISSGYTAPQTVTVTLSGATGASLGTNTTYTYTINSYSNNNITNTQYVKLAPASIATLSSASLTTPYSPTGTTTVTGTGASANFRTLVQYDLSSIPSSATILSAQIKGHVPVLVDQAGTCSMTNSVYRMTTAWTQALATWNNSGGISSNYASTATDTENACTNNTTTNANLNWNVTADVQNIVNGTNTNNGWVFVGPESAAQQEYWEWYTNNFVDSNSNAVTGVQLSLQVEYSVGQVTLDPKIQTTQTQAILHVQAANSNGSPYTGNCSYVVDDANGNLVNDVNSTLFSGANLDNRNGAIVRGNDRYFVVGTRVANKASDGKFYSRALETAAAFTAQVTCGGISSATVPFNTLGPVPGNGYGDVPNWDSSAFGNQGEPTINWNDTSVFYIDPQTGVKIKRADDALAHIDAMGNGASFATAIDLSGTGWTNPNNALNRQTSSFATTTTPNAKLFLAFKPLASQAAWNQNPLVDDMRLKLYGFGTTGDTTIADVCITIDSQTCDTPVKTVTMVPTTATEVDFPASGYPTPWFAEWGAQTAPLSAAAISNGGASGGPIGTVTMTNGSTITQISNTAFYNFLPEWPVGAKMAIVGTPPSGITTGCSTVNLCTLASFNNINQITVSETASTDISGSTLAAALSTTGQTSVILHGVGNLFPGNHLFLGYGTTNQEKVQVASTYTIGSTTVPLVAGTVKTHASGDFCQWSGLDDSTEKLNAGFSSGVTTITAQVNGALGSGGASSGATQITLSAAPTGIIPGQTLTIDTGGSQETATVASTYTCVQTGLACSATVPLTSGLTNNHAGAAAVTWGNALLGPGEGLTINAGGADAETVFVASTYTIGSQTIPLSGSGLQNTHVANEVISWTNSLTLRPAGAGVLVWLDPTSTSGTTLSFNAEFDAIDSYQVGSSDNAEESICSNLPITDISTDASGNPLPGGAKETGYLCDFGAQLFLFIPSTGESRLMSIYWDTNGTHGYNIVKASPWSSTDPKTFYGTNSGTGHVYKVVLTNPTPGVYLPYTTGNTRPPTADNLVWTDLTTSGPSGDVATQLANYSGSSTAITAVKNNYKSGLAGSLVYAATINGFSYYTAQNNGQNSLCTEVLTDGNNTLYAAFDSFNSVPFLRWGACHQGPQMVGTDLIPESEDYLDSFTQYGGPYIIPILSMRRNGTFQAYSQSITAATNASSGATFTSTGISIDAYFNHTYGTVKAGITTGPIVTISGFTGGWAGANGEWMSNITAADQDHFIVPGINTTSCSACTGTFTGSPVVTVAPPLIHNTVSSVSTGSNGEAVVTTTNGGWGSGILNLVAGHQFQDGDQIVFGGANQSRGCPTCGTYVPLYAKRTGYSATTFGVYTSPTTFNSSTAYSPSMLGTSTGSVYFAETCPTGLPTIVTSGMPFDSYGAVNARCITIRVQGQPCTWWATSGEHSTWGCAAFTTSTSDGTNSATKSQVATIQVGDSVVDLGVGPFGEVMVVVAVTVNNADSVDVTLMRFYGDISGNAGLGSGNAEADTHQSGWTPFMTPSWSHVGSFGGSSGFFQMSTESYLANAPAFSGSHGDFGCGDAPGLYTFASGSPDSLNNLPAAAFVGATPAFTQSNKRYWEGLYLNGGLVQSYPGHRQCNATAPETVWKGDWESYNPATGFAAGTPNGLVGGANPVLLSGYNNTYSIITIGQHPVNPKKTLPYSWAGYKMFKDISGAGSVINDSTLDSFCIAYAANECVTGSSIGNAYVSSLNLSLNASGYCIVNAYTTQSPCVLTHYPDGGSAIQQEINPIDTTGRRYRRLTTGLVAPGMHLSFQNWRQTPDGLWGFFSSPWVNGWRNVNFLMKIPPWRGADTVIRDQYVNVPVNVAAYPGGSTARARFGYAENGATNAFFCTTRQEMCSTDINGTDPFSYVSVATGVGTTDTSRTFQSCTSGCTINIPAIPGRILYYVIESMDSSGNVLWKSPLQVTAVP